MGRCDVDVEILHGGKLAVQTGRCICMGLLPVTRVVTCLGKAVAVAIMQLAVEGVQALEHRQTNAPGRDGAHLKTIAGRDVG